jgi:hypothetical protein
MAICTPESFSLTRSSPLFTSGFAEEKFSAAINAQMVIPSRAGRDFVKLISRLHH